MNKAEIARNVDPAAAFTEVARSALRRASTLSWGICKSCHADIDLKRLKANPSTDLCRDCEGEG